MNNKLPPYSKKLTNQEFTELLILWGPDWPNDHVNAQTVLGHKSIFFPALLNLPPAVPYFPNFGRPFCFFPSQEKPDQFDWSFLSGKDVIVQITKGQKNKNELAEFSQILLCSGVVHGVFLFPETLKNGYYVVFGGKA